jgi:hypothetical protein
VLKKGEVWVTAHVNQNFTTMKKRVNITIDQDLHERTRKRIPNFSSYVEELIRADMFDNMPGHLDNDKTRNETHPKFGAELQSVINFLEDCINEPVQPSVTQLISIVRDLKVIKEQYDSQQGDGCSIIVEAYDRAIGRTYCGNCSETLQDCHHSKYCPHCGSLFTGREYKP